MCRATSHFLCGLCFFFPHSWKRAGILPSLSSDDLLQHQSGDCISTVWGRYQCHNTWRGKERCLQFARELVWAGGAVNVQKIFSTTVSSLFLHVCSGAVKHRPRRRPRLWALLLQSPTVLFSNLIFSGTDPVLALGNWHSPYWQMFLICFKWSGQCDLFF